MSLTTASAPSAPAPSPQEHLSATPTAHGLVPDSPEYDAYMMKMGEDVEVFIDRTTTSAKLGQQQESPQEPSGPQRDEKGRFVSDKADAEQPPKVWVEEVSEERRAKVAKFKSTDDLAKAYLELQAKLSGGKQPAPQADKKAEEAHEGTQEEPQAAPADKAAAEEAVAAAGFEMGELENEYANLGDLSEESYEKLAKIGIGKAHVAAYIAGQQALAQASHQAAFEVAGGEDAYWAMADWAKSNLSKGAQAAYDRAVDSGDPDTVRLAVEGLYSKYTAANGAPAKVSLSGNSGATRGATYGYESEAQMMADMSNPQYSRDPAFRSMVERRLAATTAF